MQDPKYAYPYPAQGNSNFTFAHCFLFLIDGMVSMMILIWNNGHGFLLQQKDVFITLIMKSIYLVQHKSTQFCGNYVLVDVGYYHGPPVMAPPQYAAAPPRSSGFLEGWLVIKCSWLLLFCTQRFILYSVTQKKLLKSPINLLWFSVNSHSVSVFIFLCDSSIQHWRSIIFNWWSKMKCHSVISQ